MNLNPKRLLFSVSAATVIATVASQNSFAKEFKRDEIVYVAGSIVAVRSGPFVDAPIAALLPIGTHATYIGNPFEVDSSPNKKCKRADEKGPNKLSCICVTGLSVALAGNWCGWIATDLLVRQEPTLADLIAQFDKTPRADLPTRRKWAERAAALDPLSVQSRDRLLGTLEKMNDTKAIETAKRTFAAYLSNQPSSSVAKLIFYSSSHIGGKFLEPIAEVKDGQVVFRDFGPSVGYEYRDRGRSYYLYSEGKNIGSVVTEAKFDCHVEQCPQQTLVRQVMPPRGTEPGFWLATNFALPSAVRTTRKPTAQEKAALLKMANAWVDASEMRPNDKQEFRRHLKQTDKGEYKGVSMTIGSLGTDGRIMLIGNWFLGSMGDQHYGTGDEVNESLLIIAEQQKDGTFRQAKGSGSIAEHGCTYFDVLDLDGDGVDELFLACEQLEGQYSYALTKRVKNEWQFTYGPGR